MTHRLILASASPRRRDLLLEWGIPHTVQSADIDESLRPGASCQAQAEDLAKQKTMAVVKELTIKPNENVWALGADTLVSCRGTILGKPRHAADALAMLLHLSNSTVEVATGVCVIDPQTRSFSGCEITRLQMRNFPTMEAQAYVDSGEPMGKAGAFAIQGLGGALIESREGSFSNVVGLPRSLVFKLLESSKYPEIPTI